MPYKGRRFPLLLHATSPSPCLLFDICHLAFEKRERQGPRICDAAIFSDFATPKRYSRHRLGALYEYRLRERRRGLRATSPYSVHSPARRQAKRYCFDILQAAMRVHFRNFVWYIQLTLAHFRRMDAATAQFDAGISHWWLSFIVSIYHDFAIAGYHFLANFTSLSPPSTANSGPILPEGHFSTLECAADSIAATSYSRVNWRIFSPWGRYGGVMREYIGICKYVVDGEDISASMTIYMLYHGYEEESLLYGYSVPRRLVRLMLHFSA